MFLVPKSWPAGRCLTRGFTYRPEYTVRWRWSLLNGPKCWLVGCSITVRSISGKVSFWHFSVFGIPLRGAFLKKVPTIHMSIYNKTRLLFGKTSGYFVITDLSNNDGCGNVSFSVGSTEVGPPLKDRMSEAGRRNVRRCRQWPSRRSSSGFQ